MKLELQEDAAIEAVLDLIMRDAEPLITEWGERYSREHNGKVPSASEIAKAATGICDKLKADLSRYHFSNLKPVWNEDGKTWRLEHINSVQ